MVFAPVREGNGVYDDVVVQVFFVKMRPYHDLITFAEKPFGKLHTELVRLFGRDLAGGERLDKVIAQNAARLVVLLLDGAHFGVGRLGAFAVEGCFK